MYVLIWSGRGGLVMREARLSEGDMVEAPGGDF